MNNVLFSFRSNVNRLYNSQEFTETFLLKIKPNYSFVFSHSAIYSLFEIYRLRHSIFTFGGFASFFMVIRISFRRVIQSVSLCWCLLALSLWKTDIWYGSIQFWLENNEILVLSWGFIAIGNIFFFLDKEPISYFSYFGLLREHKNCLYLHQNKLSFVTCLAFLVHFGIYFPDSLYIGVRLKNHYWPH